MSKQTYKVIWDEALNQIHEQFVAENREEEFMLWFKMDYIEDSMTEITVAVKSAFMWKMMVSSGYNKLIEDKMEEICGLRLTLKHITSAQASPAQQKQQSPTARRTVQQKEFVPRTSVLQNPEPVRQPEPEIRETARVNEVTYFESEPQPAQETDGAETEEIPETRKFVYPEPVSYAEEETYQETVQNGPRTIRVHSDLSPELNFDNFVDSESTNYAYSVSLAAAQNPGKKYNPLIIYGGVGLGKTHLMQAIGNHIYNNPPAGKENISIIYTTGEEFTNDFTASLRSKTPDKFKNKYRKVDVLLLDDIHFLLGKESMQEELFHTFEALMKRGAQMVFTCDRPLNELKGFHERLLSRCKLGRPASLQMPNYETRKAILQKKLEEESIKISDEILDYIAKSIQSNVRELLGCIKLITGIAELTNKKLTLEMVRQEINSTFMTESIDSAVSVDTIQRVVAEHYNISLSDMKSKKRSAKITMPRHIAIHIARELTDYSYPELGTEFGGKDHTTVMYSDNKIRDLRKTDETMNATVKTLIKAIREYKKP